MALGHRHDHLVVAEVDLLEARERSARPGRGYAEFRPPGANEVAHDDRVRDHELDRQVAAAQLLVLDEPPREHELGDRVAHGQPDGGVLVREAGHQLLDGVGLREQLARLDVEALAGLGRRDPARRSHEQLRARERLERAHPLRQGGLAHAQQPGGAAEAAEVHRGAECAQLGQVHGPDQSHNPRIGP